MYENNTTYVGLDVHKKSIFCAVLEPDAAGPRDLGKFANDPVVIKRLAKRLKKQAPGPLATCYEAGPCGYALQRQLRSLDVDCMIAAPSLIPRKPGERVKTDRLDARKLAEYLRMGLLTEVHPPTPEEEAARDLSRAREDAKKDQMSARHRLLKFLLRHGHIYRKGRHWTLTHYRWLRVQKFDLPLAQATFDTYMLSLEQITERLEQLERQLCEAALSPPYAEKVGWLRCLRGVDTVMAMTLLVELHDFRRFTDPRQLMSYLGLVQCESTSDGRGHRGGITKTGNGHARRMLVQAAWNYRHRPSLSAYMKKRREGQPAKVLAIADKAQQRLHRKYRRMKARLKPHNVINVAVARELVGFIWAVMQHETAGQEPATAANE